MTSITDTHCHVDLYSDPLSLIARARTANVGIVAVTETPSAYRSLRLRLGNSSENVVIALGAHPLRVSHLSSLDKALFFRLLPNVSFVGEVGLDFSPVGVESKTAQVEFFERLLSHPNLPPIPLTIHSRRAERTVVDLLTQSKARVILHWFSGSTTLIEKAVAHGIYFSINPAMLKSKSGARVMTVAPPDRILIETDGPFVKVGSRPSEPTDALLVIKSLAEFWKIPYEAAREQVGQNLADLAAQPVTGRIF